MRKIVFILIIILISIKVWSQTDTEFWFVAPEVSADHGDNPVLIRITTATLPSDVKITMPANTAFFPTLNYSIAAYSTLTINLTALGLQPVIEHFYDFLGGVPGKSNKGIYIEATNPVTAMYEVSRANNCDIFALKGKNALGTEFYGVFQNYGYNMSTSGWGAPAYSALEIVATEDGTTVTFESTQGQDFYAYGPGIHNVTLNKGESFSIVPDWNNNVPTGVACALVKYANDFFGRAGVDHLSGVRVTSNKNITIIKKDDSVRYNCVGGWTGGCYDLIGDQLVPLEILGLEYIAMRGALTTAPENIYIVATENNTDIFIDGAALPVANIDEGETYMFEFWDHANPYVHIRGDKKISVLHISGFGCEVGGAILPPTDKCTGSTQVAITRSSSEGFFINLMVWSGAEDEFYIDGILQDGSPGTLFGPGDFTAVGPNWLIWRSPNLGTGTIAVGAQTLVQNTEDVFHLGVINGGTGTGCRFGYFSDFNELKVAAEATGSGSGEIRACSYEQIQLYSSGGTTFDWWPANYLSDPTISTPLADPPAGTSTIFYVEVSGACGLTDTANVTVTKFPHVEAQFATNLGNGCSPLAIEFHETSTQINERYWDFNYSDIGGFPDRDTVLYGNNNNYDPDTTFTHVFINTTNEGDPDSIQNYEVRLLVKNSNDCSDTAFASLIVYPEVTADFTLTDLNDSIGCTPHLVEYINNSNNEDFYYWEFGDGVSVADTNPTHVFTNIYNVDTIYNTVLVVRSRFFCRDTIDQDILLHPYLEAGFTIDKYEGCSPLEVEFNNNSVFEDSLMLVYGDGDTLFATSMASVIHTYRNSTADVDTNTVELFIYNDEGCAKLWTDTIVVFPEFVADYTIDGGTYVGCNSRTVTFTNTTTTSLHAASEFLWSFGDGSNSNVANPAPHLYNNTSSADRVYNFNLHAESQYGCSDDTADFITIYRAFADFTVDITEDCSPFTVDISNISEGSALVYDWTFDNGELNSALANPPDPTYINTTAADIIHNLQLQVTGNGGCSTTANTLITSHPEISVAIAPLAPSGCDSLVVNFTSSIVDAGLAGVIYNWNFGDATSSALANPQHVYRNLSSNSAVNYPVRLDVETLNGCTNFATTNVTVNPYVKANFTIDESNGCSPHSINVTPTYYIGINEYRWDFDGDAITDASTVTNDPQLFSFAANTTGADITYPVTLDVFDPSTGCTDTHIIPVTVYSETTADFNHKGDAGCNEFTVDFDNLSSANATSFLWDFGDGTTTTTPNPLPKIFTNTLDVTKPYNIQLTATTDNGCSHNTSANIFVYRYVNAEFAVDISEDCSPIDVTITNNSRGGTYRWFWNSQTGAGPEDLLTTNSSGILTHQYTNTTGSDITFYLTVVAENSDGCTEMFTKEILVHSSITADFDYVQTSQCNPSDVVFTNTSIGGGSYNMDWDFGDGSSLVTTSNIVNKTLTNNLPNNRDYTVIMSAESENGCIDTHQEIITVFSKLVADFSIPVGASCPPFENALIENKSVGNNLNNYKWFVDGSAIPDYTSTGSAPFIRTYNNTNPAVRTYDIRLLATNQEGCTSEKTGSIEVYEYIKAQFAMDKNDGCTPLHITFDNQSIKTANTKYLWIFNDGATSGAFEPPTGHDFYHTSRTLPDKPFTIELRLTSENYCTHDTSDQIMVYHQPLSKFFIDNTSSCPPLISNFNNFDMQGEDSFKWLVDNVEISNTATDTSYSWDNTDIDDIQYIELKLWTGTNNGCTDSDSLILSVFPKVVANFTMDKDVGCNPLDSVQFTNTSTDPGKQFYWLFRDGTSSNNENPMHDFANVGSTDKDYRVLLRAASEYNCSDTISKNVRVYVQPEAEFYMDPKWMVFPNNIVNLNNLTNFGPFEYNWNFGDINNSSSTAEQPNTFEYEHWGEKIISLDVNSTTSSNCTDTYTDTLLIMPPLVNADFIMDIDTTCLNDNEEITFNAFPVIAYGDEYEYEWDFGDGTGIETGEVVYHTYNSAGLFFVRLVARSMEIGREDEEDFTYKQVRVYANPIADFEVSPKISMVNSDLEARVEFFNLSECFDTVGCKSEWDFGDGNTSFITNITHSYQKPPDNEIPKEFDIMLKVTNSVGCVDSLIKLREVTIMGEGDIKFPNAFAPNSTIGYNQVFKPVSEGVIESEYELLVYNRWGELIFTTKDLNAGWNGKINGELAKPDVYVWKATGKFTNGRSFELAGDITLIR